jgi:AcrR family transcriptional regulator
MLNVDEHRVPTVPSEPEHSPGASFEIGSNGRRLFGKSGAQRMARGTDRRVQRTEQLLRSALFSLIEEKGFEELAVQEILDRANVGRATFYAHFDNKEDLLVSGFDGLRASLRERQRDALSTATEADERVLAFSREMFAHANDHRRLFQAMVGKRSGAVTQQMLHRVLVDLVREELKATAPGPATKAGSVEPLVQFIAGAFYGLLMWWLQGKMRLSVEEIDGLFRRLALPAMKAAQGM